MKNLNIAAYSTGFIMHIRNSADGKREGSKDHQ
jgi:hypothetical protein